MDKNDKRCEWCNSEAAMETILPVYWELPCGTRAIQITDVPSVSCEECRMNYQEEQVIGEIEDQLMLVDTSQIEKVITHKELMKLPRMLKRNYFRF
ncbi:YokU family protein [Rossellomorea aquimaris]|uniref:YokU family protein n=1 Tax=Rossellomorea aquimaris TaxID=189382 RepID=UPI0007D05E69|nr:YokU family protein [Rossellomorea aquimaris]